MNLLKVGEKTKHVLGSLGDRGSRRSCSLCWLPGGKIYFFKNKYKKKLKNEYKIYYITMLDFSVHWMLMKVYVGCKVVKLKSHVAKFKTVTW